VQVRYEYAHVLNVNLALIELATLTLVDVKGEDPVTINVEVESIRERGDRTQLGLGVCPSFGITLAESNATHNSRATVYTR
jgi:hypothetical protein